VFPSHPSAGFTKHYWQMCFRDVPEALKGLGIFVELNLGAGKSEGGVFRLCLMQLVVSLDQITSVCELPHSIA